MKTGKSLTQLAQEIERQSMNKKDLIADTRSLALVVSDVETGDTKDTSTGRKIKLAVFNGHTHTHNLRPLAHNQIPSASASRSATTIAC